MAIKVLSRFKVGYQGPDNQPWLSVGYRKGYERGEEGNYISVWYKKG